MLQHAEPITAAMEATATPARRAPQLLWHQRSVQSLGAGMYCVTVPLFGRLQGIETSRELGRILEQMWVRYPTSELSAATAVSVAISADEHRAGQHTLVVHLTIDPASDRRVDGTLMARHLRAALDQLSGA